MPASDDQRVLDLLPGYVLGTLEGEELELVEQRLAEGSPELERALFEQSRVLESMAEGVPPVAPSETTRARLLRRVEREGRGRRVRRGLPVLPVGIAAAALVALVGWSLWTQAALRRELGRVTAERQRIVSEVAGLREELRRTDDELQRLLVVQQVVAAPRSRSIVLAALGEDAGGSASGRTYHDPNSRRAVFYAAGLPAPPGGRTYQLWYIADGLPVSAGVFAPDAAGGATLLVENVARPESIRTWAVTVEPAGGVPQPTGPMILAG
jgi:anti-sigma-K factor RskA